MTLLPKFQFRWFGIFALLLSSVLLVNCEKPTDINSSANPPLDYELPMKLSVKDTQGRTLKIRLLSRDDESMNFVRLADNLEFTLPLNRLSPEDRALVMKFPKTELKRSTSSIDGMYIASRQKEIKRLTESIKEIREFLSKGGQSPSTVKSKKNELERKLAEIEKMKQQISEKQKNPN